CSEVGDIARILRDGETALLVPAGDAAALATALDSLAGDAVLRRRLGRNGRRFAVERLSLARATAWLLSLLRDVARPDAEDLSACKEAASELAVCRDAAPEVAAPEVAAHEVAAHEAAAHQLTARSCVSSAERQDAVPSESAVL